MDVFFRTLPGIFDTIDASDEVRQAFVFAAWRRVAGEQIVERTAPIDFIEKRLVIGVADNTWKRNLETLAAQLVFKLNAMLGRPTVNFVEFRIVPDLLGSPTDMTLIRETDQPPIPVEVAASANSIGDPNLRKTVLLAAANCLARPH